MTVLNGFDKISVVYDLLAKIVFGKSIKDSQRYFINDIPAEAKILIMGGGTGWLLAEIVKAKPACEVWYIEASEKMILSAIHKSKGTGKIQFIHGTENNIPQSITFDVVITNFYLDLFSTESLKEVICKIILTLKPDSYWIATDFIDNKKWWQHLILKIMYIFFRLVSGIEAQQLPNWNEMLQQQALTKVSEKFFYYGFIETAIYRREITSGKDFSNPSIT